MKDHILSSSSQPSTLSNLHRLYIVTGKGGVGKTTLALALSKHLVSKGLKAVYHSFDQGPNPRVLGDLNIPHFELELNKSTEKYVASKLGAEIIGKIVTKTTFFSSLLGMLPGLAHTILLGHVLNKLELDKDLIIVMDSPSSGHARTMLEAPQNFKEIFKSGLLVKDIDRMHRDLSAPQFLKTVIVVLPSLMAVTEGLELKKGIKKFNNSTIEIILNDSLIENESIKNSELSHIPTFLKAKIGLEKDVLENYKNRLGPILPHINEGEQVKIINRLLPYMEAL